MKRIQFWAADQGACGHYRCVLPGGALREVGHTVRVDMILDRLALCETDVVVGQRVHSDQASATWQGLAGARTGDAKLVYELDDDVWALPREVHNPASREWDPSVLRNVEANLKVADAVTVTTWQLAEVVAEHTSAPIHIVPNAVPDALLETALPPRSIARTLGWSGSNTHNGDWLEDRANAAVMRWLGRTRGVQLVTIGRPPAPLSKAAESTAVWWEQVEGTRDVNAYYAKVRTTFDVGLAPLARTTFNRSKSDLRLLELAAMGIPWVATDYGPYEDRRDGPKGGVTVTNFPGWAIHLDGLMQGTLDYRKELIAEGTEWAKTRTVSKVLPLWQKALGLTIG